MHQRTKGVIFVISEREKIIEKLKTQINRNGSIIGVATGAGISAKCAAEGGADLILALNSGRFRQMGLSSLAGLLPYANCNELVMQFASREIIPIVKDVPVIFGLCATDPTIHLEEYIDLIRDNGFAGINNYPTIGMIDGLFGEALEEENISFETEVEAVRIANEKNFFSIAFVFNKEQAVKMAEAGADVICAHLGFTKGGVLGAKEVLSLEAGVQLATEIFEACDEIRDSVIKMIYGGPVNTPSDVKYMYDNTGASGYLGGSSFERIPSEAAIKRVTREFKTTGQIGQDGLLNKELEGATKNYDYVGFVKKYVAMNYTNDLSFADLAAAVHISRTHLSSLFRKEVGCTFPEYLAKYRVNKAIDIIKRENIQLSDIANMVGYKDYAHFSKTFKRQTGRSPREFKQQYKNT